MRRNAEIQVKFSRRRLLGGWRLARLAAFVAIVPLLCAAGVWSSWIADNAVLRKQALAVTAGLEGDAARIRAVNSWVYRDQSFAPNRRYFVWPALGPTPMQVMASGGDCADKSRLVSAMLRQIGIDSGLLMMSPCRNCPAIHTVVEARYEGGRMIVDPVWGIDYPAANGGYLGARELAGTELGPEHVAALQRQSPPGAKIREMPADEARFDFVTAVNWNKNFATRAAAFALRHLGIVPEQLTRPHVLEDPKLALGVLLVAAAAALIALGAVFGFAFPGLAAGFDRPGRRRLGRAWRA